MGTICILIGLILLVVATLGGFLISHAIISNDLYMSLLGMASGVKVYGVVVGACFAIGLLICLALVMSGLTYNRVSKNYEILKRITRQ